MKSRSVCVLAVLVLAGCGGSADNVATDASSPEPEAFSTVQSLMPIPDTPAASKAALEKLEQQYSCQLPDDYSGFLHSKNGAFPALDCITFEEGGRKTASDVFCFFALDHSQPGLSMNWHRETFSERLPKDTLPIGRDSGGNLWLLSLLGNDAGSVFFWDHGTFETVDETDLKSCPKVASSFTEFRNSLGAYDPSVENGSIPSRYSLMAQATNGMVKRDPSFSTQDNPDFVWHCDCDESGDVSMQFVQYEILAIAAHTCGYTRLRRINGMIEEGQPRLPQ